MHVPSDGRPKFFVAVLVFVVRDGKVLLGKRKGHGEGTWCLPGGHLETGESMIEAANRELTEETGMIASSLRYLHTVNHASRDLHYVHVSFLAEDIAGEPRLTEPDRFFEWGWFPLGALPNPFFLWNVLPVKAFIEKRTFLDNQATD